MDPDEQVLCVPTAAVKQIGMFQGFNHDWGKYVYNLLRDDVAVYLTRRKCEGDPSFKQIIPYVMFRRTASDYGPVWLRYNRTAMSGEQRLRGKASVGIGGHITFVPGEVAFDAFNNGWRRELTEEVRIDTEYSVSYIGVLNDDADDVGCVHFGVVVQLDLDLPCVYPADETTQRMHFAGHRQLLRDIDEFEGWSKLCIAAVGK